MMATRSPQENSWQRMQQNIPQTLRANAASTARAKNPSGRVYIADFHNIEINLRTVRDNISRTSNEDHRAIVAMTKDYRLEETGTIKERDKVYNLFEKTMALENEIASHRPPNIAPHPSPMHQPKALERDMHSAEVREHRREHRHKRKHLDADEFSGKKEGFVSRMVDKIGAEAVGVVGGLIVATYLPAALRNAGGTGDAPPVQTSDATTPPPTQAAEPTSGKPSGPSFFDKVLGAINPISSAKADTLDPSKIPPRSPVAGTAAAKGSTSLPTFSDTSMANDRSFTSLSERAQDRVDALIRAYKSEYAKHGKELADQARYNLAKDKNQVAGVNGLTPGGRTVTYDPKTNTTTVTSAGGSAVTLPGDARTAVNNFAPSASPTTGLSPLEQKESSVRYHAGPGASVRTRRPGRGALAANQKEAYAAARAQGLDDASARALVANMSGEALSNPKSFHHDPSRRNPNQMAHGIVQWDDNRSARIAKQFGKLPNEMSVAEQTKAAIWEMKTYYPGVYKALMDPNLSAQDKVATLVTKYEIPADKATAIYQRVGFLQGLPKTFDGGDTKGTPTAEQTPKDGKQEATATQTPAGQIPAPKIVDISDNSTYGRKGEPLKSVQGFVFHHTGSDASPTSTQATLNKRGLGIQYAMDRDGTIYRLLPDGTRGAHILPSEINNLSNANTEGMEISALNDKDVTPAQVKSAEAFIKWYRQSHPGLQVYGHGELNPGHKQATEGMTVTNAIRALDHAQAPPKVDPIEAAQYAAKGVTVQNRGFLGTYAGKDVPTAKAPQPTPPPAVDPSAPSPTNSKQGLAGQMLRMPDQNQPGVSFYDAPVPEAPPVRPDPDPPQSKPRVNSKGTSAANDSPKGEGTKPMHISDARSISTNQEDINFPTYSTGVA
jgi:hypothetical protein